MDVKTDIGKKRNFFISYTGDDEQWATWIAGTLELAGHTTVIQAWDFKPGGSFVADMHKALRDGERCFIPVLSKKYLEKTTWCEREWTSDLAKDPSLEKALFIPVRIEDIEPDGLFAAITYIDLYGKSTEEKEKALLDGVSLEGRPRNRPSDPGTKKPMKPGDMPFNNLLSANPNFTGRAEELEKIRAGLESGERLALTQSITGLGGVGKTQIALRYAYKYGHTYPESIWWIDASGEERILAAYRAFALARTLIDEKAESSIVIEAVCNWMVQHEGWLFIFDNADGDGIQEPHRILIKYLPQHQEGRRHIMITSRYAFWEGMAEPVEVNVFSEDEAKKFLYSTTGLPDDAAQVDLLEALGRLPLALAQAAAYIVANKKRGVNYQEYLRLFEKRRLAMFDPKICPPLSPLAPKDAVNLTWNISIEKINDKGARQLLNCCACLNPDNIQLRWLEKGREHLPEPLKDDLGDELRQTNLVNELCKYSLVTANPGGLSLHRLVQEVVREALGKERDKWRDYCLAVLDECRFSEFPTVEARREFQRLAPHIQAAASHGKTKQQKTLANLCHFLGYGFNELPDYDTALTWYQRALDIYENILGKNHPDIVTAYNGIANVYHWKGEGYYSEALNFLEKALAIRKKVLDCAHSDTAISYRDIAHIYLHQRDWTKALEFFGKALEISEKVLGYEHPDTGNIYNGIGAVYRGQSNYAKALEFCNKALAIHEKVLGNERSATATTYNNIALLYKDQGNYANALDFLEKALVIRKKIFGEEHPSTAEVYNSIASVHEARKEHEQALSLWLKTYKIWRSKSGETHQDTKEALASLQRAHKNTDNPQPFDEWLRQALTTIPPSNGKRNGHGLHPDKV